MNIVYILTGMGMGGAERQVCDLADQITSLGHQVTIIGLTGKQLVKPQSDTVKVVMLSMKKNPLGFLSAYFAAIHLIRQLDPDIIHAHMFHANIFARLLRILSPSSKLVCTAHSSNEGGRLRMAAYRATNFLSHFNSNVSQEAVEAFIEKGAFKPEQITAVPNGINTNLFIKNSEAGTDIRKNLHLPHDQLIFIAIGRLSYAKDYPNLLAAFAAVSREIPSAQLLIVGQGELEPDLRQQVAALGLIDKIHFLGLRRDIPALLNAADIFVLSSRYEGLPLCIGEAMACERFVVATDCGGVAEVMGDTGILVPPQNSEALAEKMLAAATKTPEQIHINGEKARQRIVELFSLENTAQKWLNIYTDLIGKPAIS